MFAKPQGLILASASPRRSSLLSRLGFKFEIVPADVDESVRENETPGQYVDRISDLKCRTISENRPEALVLAADTSVIFNNQIIGKPTSRENAIEILSMLSGNSHTVITGMSLRHANSGRSITQREETVVQFGKMDSDEIGNYVDTGSPMDKAGGYGIQDDIGSLFIDSIDGDYYNVVGLPLRRLYLCLKESFPDFEYDIHFSHIKGI